ncbi:MAG: NAD(P)/FAD-dependent oxidoreductase [Oceanospirillaceae bacterium]
MTNSMQALSEHAVTSFDIAIIGAGPAGMMAAITASATGAKIVVLNDKPSVGGQIYRNVDRSPLVDSSVLGKDYLAGADLVAQFNQCIDAENNNVQIFNNANVWHIGDDGELLFSYNGQSNSVQAKQVIVATGAMERPFPIPGWHLPGVMSAGSAQVMLKSDALVTDDAVFVGSGPLLYLIVAQYLRLGVTVKALIDTTPKTNYVNAMSKALNALAQPSMLIKGVGLLNEIRRSGTPVYRFVSELKITESAQKADSIQFICKGEQVTLNSDQFFLHQGVIPNLNATRALGIQHHWNQQQLCWQPTLDQWGCSDVEHISVAGDSSGIVGADGARLMGHVAALNCLSKLALVSQTERNNQAVDSLRQLALLNRFRTFIDRLYQPQAAHRIPRDEATVVCRCEEQNVQQLKYEFDRGAKGPNELKSMSRCGMGPCQGRMCGTTVSELLADWREEPVGDVGYYRLRSPMRLLSLVELSKFNTLSAPPPEVVQIHTGSQQ